MGDPTWVADHDELGLYLPAAAQAYVHHPFRLADPVVSGGPTGYSWLQLGPGIVVARALGLGPARVGFVWRILAGVSLGLAWFLLLRQYIRGPIVAAGVTLLLLGDVGLLYGKLLLRHVPIAAQLAWGNPGELFSSFPQLHLGWRLISPGLSLPFLLAHLALLARVRESPTRRRVVASGVALGLLVHVYFYYWTAAGLAHLLLLALDRGRWRAYLRVAGIGVLVALPAVAAQLSMAATTSSDWMSRSDKFVAISHFEELIVPRVALFLAGGSFLWLWRTRRDLLPLWCHAAAGLALLNHQLVTGLQVENFHWGYVYGPCLSVVTALLAADGLTALARRPRRVAPRVASALLIALSVVHLGSAFWLRAVEASRTAQSVAILEQFTRYRRQRALRATPPAERGGVAGDRWFVDLAAVLDDQQPLAHYSAKLSPSVDDAALDRRVALNAVLLGQTQASFEALQRAEGAIDNWGPMARDPTLRAARLRHRLRAFVEAARDPTAAAAAGVREVALPVGALRPHYLVSSAWSRVQSGPSWQVWAR